MKYVRPHKIQRDKQQKALAYLLWSSGVAQARYMPETLDRS